MSFYTPDFFYKTFLSNYKNLFILRIVFCLLTSNSSSFILTIFYTPTLISSICDVTPVFTVWTLCHILCTYSHLSCFWTKLRWITHISWRVTFTHRWTHSEWIKCRLDDLWSNVSAYMYMHTAKENWCWKLSSMRYCRCFHSIIRGIHCM